MLEIILYSKIYPIVRNTLSEKQHGFIDGRSSLTNLTVLTQSMSETLDEQGQVDVVYTDFAEAFHRIDHNVLLTKLDTFGFSKLLNNFKHFRFLPSWKDPVCYNGLKSLNYLATQGYHWGLFINYIFKVMN